MSIDVRAIQEDDLGYVLKLDIENGKYVDPDFDVETVHPWVMTQDGIMKVIAQRKSSANGTWETRTMVVEVTYPIIDGEKSFNGTWLVGSFAYELLPDGYNVVFSTVHPDADVSETVATMAAWLKGRADRSETRKEVTVWLRDRDEAGLRTLLPLWVAQGFSCKLEPGFFGPIDGWKLLYRSTTTSCDAEAPSP